MTAAEALHDGEYWLPSLFLSDETKVTDSFRRTTEKQFPCGLGTFRSEVCSPLESLGSKNSEVDEFFASLTRRLSVSESRKAPSLDLLESPEGFKVSGCSPQSILGGIESWSGRSSNGSNPNSPPATPFQSRDDTFGLIYAAAGQMARLERNAEDPLQAALNVQWRALAKPKPHQNQKTGFYPEMQLKQNYMTAVREAYEAALNWDQHLRILKGSETHCNSRFGVGSERLNQSAWPPLQQTRVVAKPSFQAVPLQRKESAGTGVFIPRRYDSSPAVPPRKRTVGPCALVPAKGGQALHATSFETMTAPYCSTFLSAAASVSQQSYDALMARRRALLDQQQILIAKSDDIASRSLEACLPQEWSY